jgi:hypothetical protein
VWRNWLPCSSQGALVLDVGIAVESGQIKVPMPRAARTTESIINLAHPSHRDTWPAIRGVAGITKLQGHNWIARNDDTSRVLDSRFGYFVARSYVLRHAFDEFLIVVHLAFISEQPISGQALVFRVYSA